MEWVKVKDLKKGDHVLDKDGNECVITSIEQFDENEMLITYNQLNGLPHIGSTEKNGKVRRL